MTTTMREQQARELGIRWADRVSEPALVRRIQMRLGQEPCCGTDARYTCREKECEWRSNCMQLVAAWQR